MKTSFIAISLVALTVASCGISSKELKENNVAQMDLALPNLKEAEINIPAGESPNQNRESYNTIIENDFKSSKANPLSTFAIDVDGASYANARRMLMDGYLPPRDAIRIEEFINYFNYNYPQPNNENPFSINSEYSQCPWAPTHQLLQIGIKGKEVDIKTAPNNNLVFLIDVSGSMNDEINFHY